MGLKILSLFLLATVPGVALTIFFWRKDRYQLEPWPVVRNTFLLGMLIVLPTALLEWLLLREPLPSQGVSLWFYAICVIGLIEESAKLLGLWLYPGNHPVFDEPMDGIVYGGALAAGFATLENIFYVFQFGFVTGVVRAVYSVPMHVLCGVLIGYGLANMRFQGMSRFRFVMLGWTVPVVLHGLFDVGAFRQDLPGLALMTAVMACLLVITIAYLRKALALSQATLVDQIAFGHVEIDTSNQALSHTATPATSLSQARRSFDLVTAVLVLALAISAVFTIFLWTGLLFLADDNQTIPTLTWVISAVPPLGCCTCALLLLRRQRSR